MDFPLGFWDISLWLGITAIFLLTASGLISPYYGKTNLIVNKKKLRNTALVVSTLFLITVAVRIASIIINP
jgi:hypothetical protein